MCIINYKLRQYQPKIYLFQLFSNETENLLDLLGLGTKEFFKLNRIMTSHLGYILHTMMACFEIHELKYYSVLSI